MAMGLLPTTFFCRMMYSESVFLLVAIVSLYGMERRWSLTLLSLIVGIGTAVRPIGVALLLPLVHAICEQQHGRKRFLAIALLIPLAMWGLCAFVLYQYLLFDEPLAFIKTQVYWGERNEAGIVSRSNLVALITLEPIWSVYDRASPGFWGRHPPYDSATLSLLFANPMWFVGTVVLVIIGWQKRWLSSREVLLSAPLLLIPYVLQGYRNYMGSMGRFSSVAFPVYIVAAELCCRLPRCIVFGVTGIAGFILAAYSALFASDYWLF